MNLKTIIVRDRRDKHKYTTDGIFALSSGTRCILIKAEAEEISTAVDIAETLRRRMYPGIDISKISISSYNNYRNNYNNRGNNNRGNNNRGNNNRGNNNRGNNNYGNNNRGNKYQNNKNSEKSNGNDIISKIEIELSLK